MESIVNSFLHLATTHQVEAGEEMVYKTIYRIIEGAG